MDIYSNILIGGYMNIKLYDLYKNYYPDKVFIDEEQALDELLEISKNHLSILDGLERILDEVLSAYADEDYCKDSIEEIEEIAYNIIDKLKPTKR